MAAKNGNDKWVQLFVPWQVVWKGTDQRYRGRDFFLVDEGRHLFLVETGETFALKVFFSSGDELIPHGQVTQLKRDHIVLSETEAGFTCRLPLSQIIKSISRPRHTSLVVRPSNYYPQHGIRTLFWSDGDNDENIVEARLDLKNRTRFTIEYKLDTDENVYHPLHWVVADTVGNKRWVAEADLDREEGYLRIRVVPHFRGERGNGVVSELKTLLRDTGLEARSTVFELGKGGQFLLSASEEVSPPRKYFKYRKTEDLACVARSTLLPGGCKEYIEIYSLSQFASYVNNLEYVKGDYNYWRLGDSYTAIAWGSVFHNMDKRPPIHSCTRPALRHVMATEPDKITDGKDPARFFVLGTDGKTYNISEDDFVLCQSLVKVGVWRCPARIEEAVFDQFRMQLGHEAGVV